MRVLDLCSGIGGFALGFGRAGIETVAFCERDPHCRAVLRKHWPQIYCHKDITRLHGEGFRGIDIISAGFPCQPFSLAGERRGTEDDRHIWPEVFRIVGRAKPRWFIGENVSGIDDKREMVLDRVLDDLESAHYETRTLEIPACGKGAPILRRRIVIVAVASGERWAGRQQHKRSPGIQTQTFPQHGDTAFGEWNSMVADRPILRSRDGVSVGMVRAECKMAGNAFLPQIAEEIGRAIIAAES